MKKSAHIFFVLLFSWTMIFATGLACACNPKPENHDCCQKEQSSKKSEKIQNSLANSLKFETPTQNFCHCPNEMQFTTQENQFSQQDNCKVIQLSYQDFLKIFQNQKYAQRHFAHLQDFKTASPPIPHFLSTHSFLL
ncbi:MAG: hypothetical protein H7A32_00850 [Deltaproteobacteria bacterium]|nr:hypothetical protein [Deltaproteobacteria bacterium]